MSPLERPVPPAGDEIHLPGPSLQPALLAAFIALALVGLTFHWIVLAIGVVGTVVVIAAWIRDARREMAELPLHDDPH